jgi:hypothetical protein
MIWKAIRHVTFVEVTSGVLVLFVIVLLNMLGLRFLSEPASLVRLGIWLVLFLAVYRIRYGRL